MRLQRAVFTSEWTVWQRDDAFGGGRGWNEVSSFVEKGYEILRQSLACENVDLVGCFQLFFFGGDDGLSFEFGYMFNQCK